MEKVSIYVPTHNRKNLVVKAVNSCLSQTYHNIEVIVCDDGSTDGTYSNLEKLYEKDERFILIRNDFPQGACVARNKAINVASGRYVTGLDDDDEFLPDRIERLIRAYRTDLSFVCSDFIIKGENKESIFYNSKKDKLFDYKDLILINQATNQVFTELWKIKKIGGFDPSFKKYQDWNVWLRLSRRFGSFLRIKEPTYIMHDDNQINRVSLSGKHSSAYSFLIEKNSDLLDNEDRAITSYAVHRGVKDLIKLATIKDTYKKHSVNLSKIMAKSLIRR
ncbi:glycosyltransferase [Halotalea alkalilenta]|uniref:glycosyltransferase n=1 Tax=Halotalea alkalilenta TaxID=376489 RepID=UPI0009DF4161|nr:glycosyltransferase [Halotalea alkalilenta]